MSAASASVPGENAMPTWGAVFFDIARTIGFYRLAHGGDSRGDAEMVRDWAQEFQVVFDERLAKGEEPGDTYFEDVEAFALKKAAEEGFSPIESRVARLAESPRILPRERSGA